MDTEMLLVQMEQDFEALAKEHEAEADNERIWAAGSPDPHTAEMHQANAAQHQLLVRMYRKLKDNCLTFIETFDDEMN